MDGSRRQRRAWSARSATNQAAYNGPIGQVVPYFGGLGYVCPDHYNPADYVCTC